MLLVSPEDFEQLHRKNDAVHMGAWRQIRSLLKKKMMCIHMTDESISERCMNPYTDVFRIRVVTSRFQSMEPSLEKPQFVREM